MRHVCHGGGHPRVHAASFRRQDFATRAVIAPAFNRCEVVAGDSLPPDCRREFVRARRREISSREISSPIISPGRGYLAQFLRRQFSSEIFITLLTSMQFTTYRLFIYVLISAIFHLLFPDLSRPWVTKTGESQTADGGGGYSKAFRCEHRRTLRWTKNS